MPGVPITACGLTRTHQSGAGTLTAINDVDLTIQAGAIVAVTGPSGSGKSTLLHLIGGMDTATAGTLTVGDQSLTNLTGRQLVAYRRHVGFVFQRFHLLAALDTADNVAAPLLPYEPGKTLHKRAHELLEQVGLADRADALPSELSGGEQQRVAIARALINDPPLLLADEPTGNLDTTTAASILDLLTDLHERTGNTVLIATHDPGIAARAGQRLHLIDGHIV